MRREHESILVDVLDSLSSYLREKGPFHVTALAARANLPHDRLKGYMDELVSLGFIEPGAKPEITSKGHQFLECYRAWIRIQKIYGLDPRAGRGQAIRFLPGGQPLHLLSKAVAAAPPAPDSRLAVPQARPSEAVEALGMDTHESPLPQVASARFARDA